MQLLSGFVYGVLCDGYGLVQPGGVGVRVNGFRAVLRNLSFCGIEEALQIRDRDCNGVIGSFGHWDAPPVLELVIRIGHGSRVDD